MDDKEERVSIPFIMETMGTHNRRMLIALLSVCITFILTIIIFVVGYTVREHLHSDRDRHILCDRLVNGMTMERLAEKYELSVRQIKNIVHKNERILFSKLP